MLGKGVLSILELNWYQWLGDCRGRIEDLLSSAQAIRTTVNWSFHVVDRIITEPQNVQK